MTWKPPGLPHSDKLELQSQQRPRVEPDGAEGGAMKAGA